ncbi:MAG: FxsA family protein [Rhodothermales bacterium]|nr:FxsA family protein [Rhodothermales bacterium]
MKWIARIFALFLIMPVVELALLVQVDRLIGFWPTIGVILFTGILGGYLARREGLSVWRRLNQRLAEGGLPGQELLDGVIILVAGALLITPGVLTDVIGFIGLFPLTRAPIRKALRRRFEGAVRRGTITSVGFDGWGAGFPSPEGGTEPTAWGGTPSEAPRHSGPSTPEPS